MSDSLATFAVVLVAFVNLAALALLVFGLLRTTSAETRIAGRLALGCCAIALLAWLALPAVHAATARSSVASWSAEDRKLVQDTVPGISLDSSYRAQTLFETIHFWPLPLLVFVVLGYRQTRLLREERKTALTDLSD